MSGVPPPSPISLRNVLDAGSSAYILSQMGGGFSRGVIVDRLRARYPGLSLNSARAAVDRALEADRGAATMRLRAGNVPIKPGEIYRPDPGATRWRYDVAVQIRSDGGAWQTVRWSMTSQASLSRDAVEQMIRDEIMQSAMEGNEMDYPFGGVGGTPETGGIIWIGVERTT